MICAAGAACRLLVLSTATFSIPIRLCFGARVGAGKGVQFHCKNLSERISCEARRPVDCSLKQRCCYWLIFEQYRRDNDNFSARLLFTENNSSPVFLLNLIPFPQLVAQVVHRADFDISKQTQRCVTCFQTLRLSAFKQTSMKCQGKESFPTLSCHLWTAGCDILH